MSQAAESPERTHWEFPAFSLAERDRRWGRVRALMAREQVDAIVGLPATGSQYRHHADVKYLTQLGNNCEGFGVFFPVDGQPTVVGTRPGPWPADNWLASVQGAARGWLEPLLDAVHAAGMARGTLALCGLDRGLLSSVRQPLGNAPYAGVLQLQAALPDARFVSATPILGEARFVKSDEEIAFLRRGIQVAEAALQALLDTARIGAFEPLVFANMYQASIAAGGTLPMMVGWYSGRLGSPCPRLEQPAHRALADGDYLHVELEGRWAGYTSQLDKSVTFGAVPAWAHDVYQWAVECFHDVLAAMRPGVTVGELRQAAAKVGRHPDVRGELIMHGRGLGDDGPLVLPNQDDPRIDGMRLEAGTVFAVKPYVVYRGQREIGHVGDTVVVTARGAERLGTWPIEALSHFD
jgi:Xaa-Pro dipeptidase